MFIETQPNTDRSYRTENDQEISKRLKTIIVYYLFVIFYSRLKRLNVQEQIKSY